MDSKWPVFFHLVESNDSPIAKLSETEQHRYALDQVQAAPYQSLNKFHQSALLASPLLPPAALISSQDA